MNREVTGVIVGFTVGVAVAAGGWFLLNTLQPEPARPGSGGGGTGGGVAVNGGAHPGGGNASAYTRSLEERLIQLEQENRSLRSRIEEGGVARVAPVQPDEFDRVPGERPVDSETLQRAKDSDRIPAPPPEVTGLDEMWAYLKNVAHDGDVYGLEHATLMVQRALKEDPTILPQVVQQFQDAEDEREIQVLGSVLREFAMATYEDNEVFEGQLLELVATSSSLVKRRAAVEALTYLNLEDDDVSRISAQAVTEQNANVRAELAAYLAAQSAAGRTAGRENLARLAQSDKDERVRLAAVSGLVHTDPDGQRAIANVLRNEPDEKVRKEAARAIWLTGGEAAPELASELERAVRRETSRDVAFELVSALAKTGGNRARSSLESLAGERGPAAALAQEYLRALDRREALDPEAIMNRVRAQLGPEVRAGGSGEGD